MGKHSALDGATVHPLVADALKRRALVPADRRRGPEAPVSAALGWPGAQTEESGLGWPGALATEPADPRDDGSVLAVLDAAAAADPLPVSADVEPPVRRSGWRRIFGGGHTSTRRDTSAA